MPKNIRSIRHNYVPSRNRHPIQGKKSGRFQVDSIDVEAVHVDHSIPGCYGFIITTSDATIVYTGDLRMHGNHPELTEDFIKAASEVKPDVMLCEGTRIQETGSISEGEVSKTFQFFIGQSKNSFVYADFSYKDIDRLLTFYQVAKQTGRKLLIDPRTGRYLDSLAKQDPRMGLPSSSDASIGIYKPRAAKYAKDDEAYYSHSNVWTSEDIRKKQSAVIFSAGSYEQLIDIKPSGGLYLHGTTESFNEAGDIDEDRTSNWMDMFGLLKIHSHCSGHASGMEIANIVNRINPAIIVPIHTESANTFDALFAGRVKKVEPNQTIEV